MGRSLTNVISITDLKYFHLF